MNGADVVDLLDLRLRVERARQLRHRIVEREFALCYPSRHEWRRIVGLARDAQGRLDEVAAGRALVLASLTGWSSVTVADAYPESKVGTEPLAFTPMAVDLVLDEQPAWADELLAVIFAAKTAREDAIEATRKNSGAASSGSKAAPSAAPLMPSASAH